MARRNLGIQDLLGLVHPAADAHSLGITSIGQLLNDCGIRTLMAPADVCRALDGPGHPTAARIIQEWLAVSGITALGFSWRLDPDEGLRLFSSFMELIRSSGLLEGDGGRIHSVYFAGLPRACDLVRERYPWIAGTFSGDEMPAEVVDRFGIPSRLLPPAIQNETAYDETRMEFGRSIIRAGEYRSLRPLGRGSYRLYGKRGDSLAARVADASMNDRLPVIRAHVGPFLPDRKDAVALFLDWTASLAKAGYLDVLSIGTSQLSQAEFMQDWTGRTDGGGVPINNPEEFSAVWRAARPMLVRSYAGSRDVESMARLLEERIDIAWHALSLWWFCRIDGRGPNSVLENLRQHCRTLRYIAATDKPFEPNVPHHFAFRGGDDLTYVLSGLVAAKAAKQAGVRRLVLQVMLNTPKSTWGICDLAKARALLHVVRELEDGDFKVYLQPRGGLDYFSPDPEKAKAQLAAVTALMDDIEPNDPSSPQIIHVVGYSEGYALADPAVVNESIQITRQALREHRRLRAAGELEDMSSNSQVLFRTSELIRDTRAAMAAIESAIRSPFSAEGLYEILASGFFAVPALTACRDEFPAATSWMTRSIRGAMVVVDKDNKPISTAERIAVAVDTAQSRADKGATRRQS